MKLHFPKPAVLLFVAAGFVALLVGTVHGQQAAAQDQRLPAAERDGLRMIKEGRQIFRFDTFGDEAFWGDALKLHHAVLGEKLGGVGPGVSPKTALAVGLKVDMDALPRDLVAQIKQKQVDLDDPATTVALLKLNAVLGVKGFLDQDGKVRSLGITCAICHSTVDDTFAPGIGHRRDGWPNVCQQVGALLQRRKEKR